MTEDGMLSQDEIDALLNVTDDEETEQDETQEETDQPLSDLEIDALGEIGNISLGSSATTLSTILNQKVEITTPSVSFVRKTGLKEEFPYEHVSLQVDYMEGFDGENIFLMKADDAAIISDIMLGGDGTQPAEVLTDIHLSAVQEAMNQMMGASATSMSTVFDKRVDISPPIVNYEDIDKLEEVDEIIDEETLVKVSFRLKIGDLIDSQIMQLIPINFAKVLVDDLLNPPTETDEQQEVQTEPVVEQQPVAQQQMATPEREQVQSSQMGQQQTVSSEPQHIGTKFDANSSIQTASFSSFEQPDLTEQGQQNLNLLLDIPLRVTVELGRTKQTVQEILDLSQGSIIELDKLAGEPVDVLVNNKLIAKGEVVVIDENFGVRVTDIISQADRLLKLN